MSARRPAKAPPRPPLALPRPSGTRTRTPAPSKPPPVTFLADEFVEDDVVEFLPQEFVVEDPSSESAAGFAGPSDPPPRPVPVALAAKALAHGTAPHARRPARITPWIPTALSAAFALVAVALAVRTRAPAETRAEQALAAPSIPQVLPAADPQPVVAEPPASPPVVSASAPGAIPEPAVVVAPAASTPVASQPPPQDAEAAKQAKLASQKALELGKVMQAITLGEQSVQLDATDAEGWLILGAAYLQRGSFKEARRCFSSCVQEATRGPRGECSALLR